MRKGGRKALPSPPYATISRPAEPAGRQFSRYSKWDGHDAAGAIAGILPRGIRSAYRRPGSSVSTMMMIGWLMTARDALKTP